MKRFLLASVALGLLSIGCAETSKSTKETKTTTPGGSTKVTQETTVEKKGDHKEGK